MKMKIIAENIHIISPRVKEALANRDISFFQTMAGRQVEADSWAVDLNIGPQKKQGVEVMTWLVDGVQKVVDVPLCLDTTNLAAIEAGLKIARRQAIINSTSAEPERLEKVPPLAAEYKAKLVALTMGKAGIPVSAMERVGIAMEQIMPRLEEVGLPIEDIIFDPLVLTVSGCQPYCPECIEAVRYLKASWDPPPLVSVGVSNVSNAVPTENRSLINRTYMAMLMAAGLDMVIADPFDEKLIEVIQTIEERDDSTPVKQLILKLHDATAIGEQLEPADVDMNDPEQTAIYKTVRILMNEVIYTDDYLRF
jgi:5-methyltetrahydrofolate corrinoid/iron sulfur protein methyltransferase